MNKKNMGNWGYIISPYLLGSRVIGLPNHFPYEGLGWFPQQIPWTYEQVGFLESVQDTLKEIIGNLRGKCLDIILSSEDRGHYYYQP